MDCVALLVVNRGRMKGALQQEVDDEVQIEEKVQVENRPLIRGKASEAGISHSYPLDLPDAAFRMLAGNEECFGEERGAPRMLHDGS